MKDYEYLTGYEKFYPIKFNNCINYPTIRFIEILDQLLKSSFLKRMPSDDPIVFLSGGIDSLIIAIYIHLVADSSMTIYLINTAVPGSFDREQGILAFNDLVFTYPNRKFVFIANDITFNAVLEEQDKIKKLIFPKKGKMDFNIGSVLYFSAKKAQEYGKIVFMGSGADEVFGGYNKYKKDDFRSHMLFDLFTISVHNICRDDRVIADWNVEARFPLLDYDIVEFSFKLPDTALIKDGFNKFILRDLLLYHGFIRASKVPKKAMQYGTGINKFERNLSWEF